MKRLKSGPALLTVEVDADLAKRASAICKENGISTSKYINNLLEGALIAEDKLARQQALEEKRRKAADRAWENHKFPKHIKVEAFDGWRISGPYYTRTFYYLDADKPSDSTFKGEVSVSFMDETAKFLLVAFYDRNGIRI